MPSTQLARSKEPPSPTHTYRHIWSGLIPAKECRLWATWLARALVVWNERAALCRPPLRPESQGLVSRCPTNVLLGLWRTWHETACFNYVDVSECGVVRVDAEGRPGRELHRTGCDCRAALVNLMADLIRTSTVEDVGEEPPFGCPVEVESGVA